MSIEGHGGLALLQNLTLLYLGLAQGVDDELDPAEQREMAARLRRWQPDKNPAVIDHVIRDMMLAYEEELDMQHIHEAVDVLGKALTTQQRKVILHDLAEIARADGRVLSEEEDFIRRVAQEWHLDFEGGIEAPSS